MLFPLKLTVCGLLSGSFCLVSFSQGQEKKPAAQPVVKKDFASTLPPFAKDIRPILQTYCFNCHGAKKKNGDLDLERIKTDFAAFDAQEIMAHVAVRLKAK